MTIEDVRLRGKVMSYLSNEDYVTIHPLPLELPAIKLVLQSYFPSNMFTGIDEAILTTFERATQGNPGVLRASGIGLRLSLYETMVRSLDKNADSQITPQVCVENGILTWKPPSDLKAFFHSFHHSMTFDLPKLQADSLFILYISAILGQVIDADLLCEVVTAVAHKFKYNFSGHSGIFNPKSLWQFYKKGDAGLGILGRRMVATQESFVFTVSGMQGVIYKLIPLESRVEVHAIIADIIQKLVSAERNLLPTLTWHTIHSNGKRNKDLVLEQTLRYYADLGCVGLMMKAYDEIIRTPMMVHPVEESGVFALIDRELLVGNVLVMADEPLQGEKHIKEGLAASGFKLIRSGTTQFKLSLFINKLKLKYHWFRLLNGYAARWINSDEAEKLTRLATSAIQLLNLSLMKGEYDNALYTQIRTIVAAQDICERDHYLWATQFVNMALLYLLHGKRKDAGKALQTAQWLVYEKETTHQKELILLNPATEIYYKRLGYALLAAGDFTAAGSHFDRMLKSRAARGEETSLQFVSTLATQMNVLEFKGMYPESLRLAEKLLDIAMSTDPCSSWSYLALVKIPALRYSRLELDERVNHIAMQAIAIRKIATETHRTQPILSRIYHRGNAMLLSSTAVIHGHDMKPPVSLYMVMVNISDSISLIRENKNMVQNGETTGFAWASYFDGFFVFWYYIVGITDQDPSGFSALQHEARAILDRNPFAAKEEIDKPIKERIMILAKLIFECVKNGPKIILNQVMIKVWKGQIHLIKGQYESAISAWNSLLDKKSKSPENIILQTISFAHLKYKIKLAVNIATMLMLSTQIPKNAKPNIVSPEEKDAYSIALTDLPYYDQVFAHVERSGEDIFWHIHQSWFKVCKKLRESKRPQIE